MSLEFETWEISPQGAAGLRIVSMPGGELAVWLDHRQPDGTQLTDAIKRRVSGRVAGRSGS